jgi:hypothetical protein
MKLITSLATLAAASALTLVPTAQAFTAKLGDPVGDAGDAADLTGLSVGYASGDADMLALKIGGGAAIPPDGDIVIGFDTDRDPATGTDGGADYLLELVPSSKGLSVALSRRQGDGYVAARLRLPVLTAEDGGTAIVGLCLCELRNPTAFGIFARSELGDSSDSVPDAGTAEIDLPILRSVLTSMHLPVAGKTLTTEITGVRLVNDPVHVVRPQSATCAAKLGAATLPLAGRCRWRLPTEARGKRIALSIKVTYLGTTTTFSETVPVS